MSLKHDAKPVFHFKEEIRDIAFIALFSAALAVIYYFTAVKPMGPEPVISRYIEHIISREYDKAALYYTDIPEDAMTGSYEINSALKARYKDAKYMALKSSRTSKGICSAKIEVADRDNTYIEDILLYNMEENLYKLGKDWHVVFPFKVQDVAVSGTEDSVVYLDGKEAGKIQGGILNVRGIISCGHEFKAVLDGIGQSDIINAFVDAHTDSIELNVKPFDDFKSNVEKVISDFSRGWSSYCLKQDPSFIKPFLTEKLFEEYMRDKEIFNGSRYTICEGRVNFKGLTLENSSSVYCDVNERWHLKEFATLSKVVFQDNNRMVLEQVQYISLRYHIINDNNVWKIDSYDQMDFSREVF